MNKLINCIKNTALILLLGIFVAFPVKSQVTIGAQISPQPGALLDLREKDETSGDWDATKGMIFPRVSLTDLNNLYPMLTGSETNYATLKSSHTGLIVYNVNPTFTKGLYVWDGAKWNRMSQNVAAENGLSLSGSDKVVLGGALTQNTTVNLGNNNLNLANSTGGKVGIGTATPSALLHVQSATNGAVRIVDGTEREGRVLMSDVNGVATWRSPVPSANTGTANALSTKQLTFSALGNYYQTGYSVTVPPGRSTIYAGFMVKTSAGPTGVTSPSGYLTCFLSNNPGTSAQHTGDVQNGFTCTPKLSGFALPVAGKETTGMTTWFVNNTTTSDMILYVVMTGGGDFKDNNATVTLGGKDYYLEPYIYAAY